MTVLKMTDLDLQGKRVLIREDLNVPVKDGVVKSDARILASLPTIKLALEKGAAVMVCSHLGRPTEGEFSAENSLKPVAEYLSKALGREVPLLADMRLDVARQYGVALDERGISGRAVFLIDKGGVVRFQHVEEQAGQYTARPEQVLAKIREL